MSTTTTITKTKTVAKERAPVKKTTVATGTQKKKGNTTADRVRQCRPRELPDKLVVHMFARAGGKQSNPILRKAASDEYFAPGSELASAAALIAHADERRVTSTSADVHKAREVLAIP